MKKPHKNLWCLCALVAAWTPSAFAETVLQTNYAPTGDIDWNNTTMWGGNAVIGSNDYSSVAGVAPANWTTAFTANGVEWRTGGTVRDTASPTFGDSTFNGSFLTINSNTRLLMKGQSTSGQTSTANVVLNGGFIHAAPNGQSVMNLAGTIITQGLLNAIGTNPNTGGNGTLELNINSTLSGGGTLQLVNAGDQGGTRTSQFSLNGDISQFLGTLYLAIGEGTSNNVALGSYFRIANSAPLATLEMNTTAEAFLYFLDSNITFASVIIGGQTLAPGVYNYAALDAIAPGKFLDSGTGSITVSPIPEPTTIGLGMAAGICLLAFRRGRQLN